MLSHDNITWTARIGAEHYGWEQERILSYLPLSHVAANMSNCFFALYAGNEVHFADADVLKTTLVNMPLLNTCTKFENDHLPFQIMNLRRVRPTKFLGVPRVWEKIAEKMKEIETSNRGMKKVIFNWAKKVAEAHHISIREGKLQSFQSKLYYRLAKKIIFR